MPRHGALLDLLDERLTRLRAGASLAECLADLDPSDRAELEPLLATAARIPAAAPTLPPAAVAAHQRLLLARAAALRARRADRLGRLPWSGHPNGPRGPLGTPSPARLGRALGYPLAGLAALLLVLFGGVVVSAESLPDSPLYALKRTGERVQEALALDAAAQARVNVLIAHRRLAEAEALLARDGAVSEELLSEVRARAATSGQLGRAVGGRPAPAVLAEVAGLLSREQALLRRAVAAAAPDARARLEALAASARTEQSAVEAALAGAVEPARPAATATPPGAEPADDRRGRDERAPERPAPPETRLPLGGPPEDERGRPTDVPRGPGRAPQPADPGQGGRRDEPAAERGPQAAPGPGHSTATGVAVGTPPPGVPERPREDRSPDRPDQGGRDDRRPDGPEEHGRGRPAERPADRPEPGERKDRSEERSGEPVDRSEEGARERADRLQAWLAEQVAAALVGRGERAASAERPAAAPTPDRKPSLGRDDRERGRAREGETPAPIPLR